MIQNRIKVLKKIADEQRIAISMSCIGNQIEAQKCYISVGMAKYGFPELVVTDASHRGAIMMINKTLANWLANGFSLEESTELIQGNNYQDLKVNYEKIATNDFFDHNYGFEVYEYYQAFPADKKTEEISFVQLIWPDKENRLPTELLYDHTNFPQRLLLHPRPKSDDGFYLLSFQGMNLLRLREKNEESSLIKLGENNVAEFYAATQKLSFGEPLDEEELVMHLTYSLIEELNERESINIDSPISEQQFNVITIIAYYYNKHIETISLGSINLDKIALLNQNSEANLSQSTLH